MTKRIQLQPIRRDPIDVAKLVSALLGMVREKQALAAEATMPAAARDPEPKP